jgi:hypothetical protein
VFGFGRFRFKFKKNTELLCLSFYTLLLTAMQTSDDRQLDTKLPPFCTASTVPVIILASLSAVA